MMTPGRIWIPWSKWYYYMIRCWVLFMHRYPGDPSSGYIGDISDGDDEDSDQNEESEEEVATSADV
jgi:hypothetical protein